MTSKPDGTTHAEGCYRWGPRHYDCAAREIERLERELTETHERVARIVTAYEAYRGIEADGFQKVVDAINAARSEVRHD